MQLILGLTLPFVLFGGILAAVYYSQKRQGPPSPEELGSGLRLLIHFLFNGALLGLILLAVGVVIGIISLFNN